MPTIADLRAANPWADDVSDLELLNYRAQQTGTTLDDAAKAFGVKYNSKRNALSAGLSAGVDELQGLGYGMLGAGARALGGDGVADWADKNVRINNSEAHYNGRPDLENIEDQSLGSMPGYLVYQGAKQLPILAGTVAGAAVMPEAVVPAALSRGLAFAPRAIGGGGLTSEALAAAEGYAAKKALTNEALAAGNQFGRIGAAAYPMSVGSLYNEAVERGDPSQADALAAFGVGVPYAAGEAVMPAIVSRGLGTGLGFKGNLPTRIGKAMGTDALGEAGTELAQNEMEMGFAGPLTDEQKFSRRLNSAVAGGLVGGMFGAPAGIRQYRPPVAPGVEADLLGGNSYPALPSPNQMPIYADNRAYPGVETVVDQANSAAAAQRAADELWAARQAYEMRDIPAGTQLGLPLDGGRMGQIDPMAQAASGPLPAEYDPTNPVRNRRQMDLVFPETPEVIYGNQYNPASQPGSTGQQAGSFTQLPVTDEIRTPPGAVQQAITAVNGTRTIAQLKATADQALANNLISPDQHVEFYNTLDTNKKLKLVDKRGLLTNLIEGNQNGNQETIAGRQEGNGQAGQPQGTVAPREVGIAQGTSQGRGVQQGRQGEERLLNGAQTQETVTSEAGQQAAVPVPSAAVPVKPADVNDLPRYKAEVQTYLTEQVNPAELQSFIGLNGLRGEDGNAEGYSTRALAKEMGVSHVTVHNRANAAKAKIEAAAQMAGVDMDTALEILGLGSDVLDVGIPTAAYDNGVRTVRLESDDFEDSFGYSRDEALGENEKGAIEDAYDEDTSDKVAVGSAEFEQVADGRDERAEYARKWRDYAGNPIKEVDVQDAAEDYNDGLMEGDVLFERLSSDDQLRWVKVYIAGQDGKVTPQQVMRSFSEIADAYRNNADTRTANTEETNADGLQEGVSSTNAREVQSGNGENERADAGRVQGKVQGSGRVSNEKDSGRDQGTVRVGEGSTNAEGNTRQGSGVAGVLPGVSETGVRKSEGTGEAENPTTVERIGKQLRNLFFSQSRFDNKVTIVNSVEDLPENIRQSANPDGFTQAFVMPNGKAYMIASRIEKGQELGVFLHEVGVHLGMEGLIGAANFTKLAKQIGVWSQGNGDSIENRVARLAYARVTSAANNAQLEGREFNDADIAHELIAYFVEEAFNAGIKPTAAAKAGGPIYNWFRTMWAGVKVALRKFGLDRVDSLTAQNIVDLAYGAAALELEGTWHGTAADFRRFDHAYMGTGEGAQAFGWGTYLAQRPGIARDYWKQDVQRKGGGQFDIEEKKDILGRPVFYVTKGYEQVGRFKTMDEAVDYVEANKGPSGSLMRTSVAATEDEMLDRDKPISQQSQYIQDRIYKLYPQAKNDPELTGADVYARMLQAEIKLNGKKDADKRVSMEMDAAGIKGLMFFDAKSRDPRFNGANRDKKIREYEQKIAEYRESQERAKNTLNVQIELLSKNLAIARGETKTALERIIEKQKQAYEITSSQIEFSIASLEENIKQAKEFVPTRNLVIFNDKNIVRAVTYQGADRGKVRFSSKANPPTPEGFFAKAGEFLDDAISNPAGGWSKIKLGWMTLEQIADRVKSDAVKKYTSVMTEMQRFSKHIIYQAAVIDQDWSKLSTNVRANLSSIMRDATRMGYDPEVDTASSDAQRVLKDRFDKTLTKEAKDVYRRVRDHYKAMFNERKQILMDAAANGTLSDRNRAEVEKMFTEVKGPYFPLMRLGKWYAVGTSKELAALQAKVDAGDITPEEQDRYRTLRKDKAHYITKSFDTRGEAKRFSKELAGKYDQSYFNTSKSVIDNAVKSTPDLAKMQDYLTAGMPEGARDDLRNMLAQMYFDMLPDSSPLKRMMKREGVFGEEEDMRKVFAASSISMAHHVSRLKHANKLSEHLVALDKETKRNEQMRHVYNELVERANLSTKVDDTPFADTVNQVSYFAHLGLSPAFILTNMTQVPMITAPWLTARYGFGKTKSALASAYVDAYKIIRGTMNKDGWEAEYDWKRLFKEGSNEDRLLSKLLEMNLIDITMEHDLGAVARIGGTGNRDKMNKTIKIASLPVRITEAANRIVTALSSYRLATDKGMTHDEAVEHAAKAISETQLNYSALNAPRYMQSVFGSKALAKMVFQFRKYQQGMVYLIASNAKDAFKGDKEAMKTLFGIMGTTGLMAGATGLPFAGSLFWLATAMGSMFDDDDEPFDARESFRNYLADMLGDDAAQALTKGLPTLMGMDISGNIGMSNIGMPLPYVRDGKKPSDSMKEMLASAAGAPFGTMMEMADGFGELMNGDMAKGATHVIPLKFAKNAIKAAEFYAEGMVDSKGNVILPSERFDGWDLAFRAAGFSTTKETEYYEANSAMQKAKQAASDTRNALLREYAEARIKGDSLTDFQERIADFNSRHPEKGIRIDQSSLIKSVQARKKLAEGRTETGLRQDKTMKPYLERAGFADGQ